METVPGRVAEFPGADWVRLFAEEINASEEHAIAAETWEGDVLFVYEADPDYGITETVYGWFDLWHGKCRDFASFVDPSDPRTSSSRFTISAPYGQWKAVMRGEVEPVKAMMSGNLRVRGDLPAIVRHVRACNVLVDLCGKVPTGFRDER